MAQAFSRPVDAGFCAACEEATKGNPLLLRELLATLAVEGIAPEAAQAGAVAQVAPPSVARSVARRLGRLPDPAGRLARATAILGSGARHRTAARLAGLDADAAQRAAGALAGAGILDAATLEFVHPLVRAAVLGDLAAPERARAHRDAAALLHRDGAPGDEVALQLLAAEPAGEGWAVEVLRGAARGAAARGAPDVAATHLRRALAEPPPERERGRLLVELGEAETAAADETGLAHLTQAAELEPDPRARASIALQLGRAHFTRLQLLPAASTLQRALDELGGGDDHLRRRIEGQLLAVRVSEPRLHDDALRHRLTALYLTRGRLSDPVVLAALAFAVVLAIPPAAAAAELAERSLAAGLSFEEDQGVFALAAAALALAGRLERARSVWDQAIADARRRGSSSAAGMAGSLRAGVHLRLGALAAAEADLDEMERTRALWPPSAVPVMAAGRATVLLERGEVAAAAAAVDAIDVDDPVARAGDGSAPARAGRRGAPRPGPQRGGRRALP